MHVSGSEAMASKVCIVCNKAESRDGRAVAVNKRYRKHPSVVGAWLCSAHYASFRKTAKQEAEQQAAAPIAAAAGRRRKGEAPRQVVSTVVNRKKRILGEAEQLVNDVPAGYIDFEVGSKRTKRQAPGDTAQETGSGQG